MIIPRAVKYIQKLEKSGLLKIYPDKEEKRVCKQCNKEKDIIKFEKYDAKDDKRRKICGECRTSNRKNNFLDNISKQTLLIYTDTQVCKGCCETKTIDNFNFTDKEKTKRSSKCKSCIKIYKDNWRLNKK